MMKGQYECPKCKAKKEVPSVSQTTPYFKRPKCDNCQGVMHFITTIYA